MNYLELAEAYDKQADVFASLLDFNKVEHRTSFMAVFELREKAQDCRCNHEHQERQRVEHEHRIESDKREFELRVKWCEAEVRQAAALEAIASGIAALAGVIDENKVLLHGPRGTEIVR